MTPTKEFDAIVVGTGPAGGTIAKDLSREGQKVLILEWGSDGPATGSLPKFVSDCFLLGKSLYLTRDLACIARGVCKGGSSLYYCGTAFEPPYDMMNAHGIDLLKDAASLKEEVPFGTLSDELMAPGGKLFLQSALELGYPAKKNPKFIYQDKCRPKCQLCMLGCPYNAKWNGGHFIDDALEEEAKLVAKARVTKVLTEGKRAVGVEYRKGKDTYRAHATNVILAAGGLGSPMILRETGIRDVGHGLFFDPLRFVFGTVKEMDGAHGVPMSSVLHFEDDGILMTDLHLPRSLKTLFDLHAFKPHRMFSFDRVLPIMVKVRDDLGGGLTRKGWVSKRLRGSDFAKLDKGIGHAERILTNLGATGIYKSWVFAAHPGGTVKIGELVDANLKTEIDNLYVCDASVIPRAWGLPPTFTVMALGRRLSRHLTGRHEAVTEQETLPARAVPAA
jgi:choline dehydrogenase-like flavoprotein